MPSPNSTHPLSARFVKSAPALADAPDLGGLPEIALAGRSNVGKSSFINAVLGRKGLAKTSNTPGKTRLMNFYQVGDALNEKGWVFVDLPGYGYAKVSKEEQQRWQQRLETFLLNRPTLRCVLLLVDARHAPKPSDLQMRDWLAYHNLPHRIVLAKTDKVSKNALPQHLKTAAAAFQMPAEEIVPFSIEQNPAAIRRLLETLL